MDENILHYIQLLDKVDFANQTVCLEDKVYPLLDAHFPTVDRLDPYALTSREASLIERLKLSFTSSARLLLAAHLPYESVQKAVEAEQDITPATQILETNTIRIRVKDTDLGLRIQRQIDDLQSLLAAYRSGLLQESLSPP